jgi:signal transduction histidine kinase
MSAPLGGLAPLSLRWRLAGWVAVVILICTGITFVAVYRGTATQLHREIDREIRGDASEFAHALRVADPPSPARAAEAAERYVVGQPFAASSTLLFATVPGAGTSTNRPELFGHGPPDNGETPAEQARENRASTRLLSARDGYSTVGLPDVGNVRLLKRTVRIPANATGPREPSTAAAGGADEGAPISPAAAARGARPGSGSGGGGVRQVSVGVGEPLAAVAHAQRGVARAFILAGILALVGALLGSYLIGTRVSRPLRRMAAVAARVDAGDLHPRIHDAGRQGDEVRVLADAFNHMLDRLTAAFAGQREFVADASHELRTPLTVIRGQLEVLAAQEDPPVAEVRRVERLVQAEIARIGRLVDDLLLLARSEQTQFLRIEPIDLPAFVRDLWAGMTMLARRRFELGPLPAGTLRADPDRLAQAIRNLVGNAIEHTAAEDGLVRLRVDGTGASGGEGPGRRIRFLVEDDGPGIARDQRGLVFERFHRTDPARDRASGGTGLGLAIVDAIARAHGGRVAAGESLAGGACMELELPDFTAAPPDAAAPPRQAPDTGAVAGPPAPPEPARGR